MEENATNSKAGEENDSQGGTPSSTSSPAVAPNNTPVSTPDLTPSRRSSRKKQSTFSSDFEYYSIGRKKDTPKEEKEEAEEKEADKEDAKPVAKKAAQAMQRKVAVRGRPPGKAVTPKASNKKVTPKAAVKKAKTTPPKKTKAKGKAKEESEDEEEDDEDNDDQDEEESAEEVETKTPVKKTQKRKKAQSVAKKKKAKKADPDEEQESMSDDYDDDSTPISKLKAQMVTPEPKQLTSPPAKKKISVLTATSPLAKNLMSKLKKASMEVLSSPEGLLSAKKRKLSVGGKTENGTGVDDDDVPLKKLQVEKQEKDESEADPLEEAGLIKRSPSEAGLVKRSPSEIAKKKTGATVKTESKSTVDKIEEEINDTEAQLLKTNEPVDDVTEKKTHNADAQTSKKEKVKNEDVSGGDAKKKSGAVEKVEEEGMKEVKGEVKKEVKKEIKKDVKAAKGEGSKKLAAKAGSPVKKESNVVKRVMKVVKTADGRVIKGEVRILKDGRKVMVIDGKQKVLVTGKDKEKKQAASVDQKAEVKKDGAKKVESTDQGAVKKVVKTPDGKKKVMKKDGGKVSPPVKSKTIAGAKKSVDGTRKTSIAQVGGKKVDDLLKRGVMVKKKRHQPFGNKKTVTKMVAPPPEVEEKQVKKRALSPKSAAERKERKKSVEKATVKKGEETERRKSSDSSQHVRDRSQSTDSSKGDRRKSADLGKPASSEKNNSEEAPPTLIPANAVSKPHKHKHHHKPEHDTSMLDMTMNDLFKPDAIFTPKKEQEAAEAATVKSATTATAPTPTTADDVPASTAAPSTPIREDDDKEERASDADSPIKPQNLPNVLIEHKYSKPTSPVDGEAVPPGLEQQDLNSISIPTSKFVTDMTLPDQFMEELEAHDKEAGKQDKEGGKQDKEGGKQDKNGGKQDKEAGKQDKEAGKQDKEAGKQDKDGGKQDKDGGKQDKEGGKQDKEAGKQDKEGGKQDKEGGKQDKDDAGRNKSTELSEALDNSKSAAVVGSSGGGGSAGSTDRSCILQTLDTEIQEGGSDFLIVGQVEIERPSVVAAKEEKVEQVEMVKIPVSTTEQSSSTSLSSSKTPEKSKDPVITAPVVKEATEVEESDVKTVEKPKRKIKVKRQDSSDTEVKEKKKKVPPKEKTPKKDKEAKDGDKKDDDSDINDEDEGEDFVDDENDDDWDDPTTLYCICKKPHGNRFMICCDKCEEWYHGSCVGVTRARGKEMEDNEEEYICRSCHKNKTPSKLSSTTTPIKPAAKSPVTPKSTTTPSSSTTTTTTSSSSSSSNKALPKLCVGKKCPKTPRSGSAYCSNECIMSHTQDSLKAIREEEIRRKSQDKFKLLAQGKSFRALAPKMLSTVESVVVIDKDTEKVIMGSAAPSYRNLRQWLEDHPTFQVFLGGKHKLPASAQRSISTLPMPGSSSSKDGKHKDKDSRHSSSSSGSHHHHHKSSSSSDSHDKKDDKSRRESKDGTSATTSDGAKKIDGERRRSSSSSSSSKTEGPSSSSSTPASHSKPEETNRSGDGGPNQVRLNVRTALRNSLSTRAEGADDIMLSSNEIKNLAMTIEEELFNLFMDTGHKYRTKYRSLVFNIKDTKNKGLFRKILTGKIKPYKLVQMSTEEMASRELARWREKETQHQLEMIEQTEKEKEILVATKHIRKKTHKGEIEVEDEDLSILEARVDEKVDKVNESQDEMIQVPVVDTTDQHRAHLFDLNCKVCTGKIVPGPEEQQMLAASSTKKVTFSFEASTTKIISDDEQCAEPDDFAKAEEIVKEAMRTVKKTSEAVSSYSPPPQSSESPPDAMMPESPPPESTSSLLAMSSSPKHDSVSSSSSAAAAAAALDMKKVVVRSPDSALQSGLEVKAKFVPTGPLLWKGCISMLDVAKFFTSAYRVSGPFENITIPDTIHIMGRISPEHMWDYLSKIRQAGSKDLTVVRFIPGSDDEKVAYVHLYSYLNSRSRCGVAGSDNNKQIKDFYVIPLASHSKIPRTLLPFDGPGLEENRPHMLIGIIVKQRGKHSSSSDSPSTSSSSSKSKSSSKNGSSSSSSTSSSKHQSTSDRSSSSSSKHKSSSSSKDKKPVIVNRDPRLAKLAAAAKPPPSTSPTGSTSSVGSSHNSSSGTPNIDATASPSSSSTATPSKGYGNSGDPRKAAKKQVTVEKEQKKEGDVYEPEYVPMPVKAKVQPIAEYVPTVKKKDKEMDSGESRHHHHSHNSHKNHHSDHHHHNHHHHQPKSEGLEDDSEPYSPGKEAEPYSPSQEAQADEPYDPGDETLMDGSGVPLTPTTLPQQPPPSSKSLPSTTSSSSSSSSSSKTTAASSKSSTPAAVATTTNTASAAGSVTSTTTQAKQPPAQPTSGAAVGDGGDGKKKDGDGQVGNLKLKSTALVTKGGDSPFSIDDCVEKMARSNNPTEISSLMVTALSTASSPEEQQKLLVDLTKRVEERKLQLANLLRASAVASASASATSASYNNPASGNSSATGKLVRGEESVTNVGKSADSTSTTTATTTLELGSKVSSSSADDPAKDVASADSSSALSEPPQQQKGFGFGFMRTSSKTTVPLSTTSADIFNSDGSKTVTADVEKPMSVLGVGEVQQQESSTSSSSGKPQIPHALKALMDDVLGNTQGLNEEKRQKILKKEEKKQKDRGVEDEPPMNDDCSEKTEAERRMEDELEAQKILEQLNESEKAIGLPGGGKKETSASGSAAVSAVTAGGDGSSATGGGEPKKDKVPTIDELLEKLKKGGFQFPVAAGTGKTSSSTAADAAAALSSTIVSSSTTETTSSTTTSSLTLSVLGNLDTQDVDLRTATGTPPLLSTVTSSMGMTENPTPADTIAACLASLPKPISSSNAASISPPLPGNRLDLQDIDHRKSQTSSLASLSPPLSTTAVEKDDHFASSTSSFYEQDRDDRIFHQSHQPHPPAGSNRPKHPLDPRAFPPLPGELPRGSGYPHPPHHPLPPRPSGHFPQPKSGRAQPPPPGTELEATPVPPSHPPPHPDLHVSDIDMRSGNHHPHHRPGGVPIPPPLPPEQAPPPLPPQPPPPLPPLPGNRGGGGGEHPPPLPPTPYQDYPAPPNPGYPHHEHLPPSDVDFRSHHHPHPHHLPPPQHPHHHHQQPPHPHHHHPHQHHPHHQSSSHHPPPSSHHSDNWYHDRGGGGGDRDRERDRGDRRDQDYHRRSGYSRNGGGGGRRH